jgi:hypothetical protein
MIDGLCLEEDLWRDFSAFLDTQWDFLTEEFVQARQCDKFTEDLHVAALLRIRCTAPSYLLPYSRSETMSLISPANFISAARSDANSL